MIVARERLSQIRSASSSFHCFFVDVHASYCFADKYSLAQYAIWNTQLYNPKSLLPCILVVTRPLLTQTLALTLTLALQWITIYIFSSYQGYVFYL